MFTPGERLAFTRRKRQWLLCCPLISQKMTVAEKYMKESQYASCTIPNGMYESQPDRRGESSRLIADLRGSMGGDTPTRDPGSSEFSLSNNVTSQYHPLLHAFGNRSSSSLRRIIAFTAYILQLYSFSDSLCP